MDLSIAYRTMEKACGFKKGDRVKVLRTATDHELGWNNVWTSEKNDWVGKVLTVKGVDVWGVIFNDVWFHLPWFVLEIVERAKPVITIDGKEITISEESYNALKDSLK